MPPVSDRTRRTAALLALGLGGFAIGLTEFVVMGVLPEMARDLLPATYASSTSDAVARTGWAITTYGLGVVVGAPTIAALTARVPRKRLVIGLLALFVAATAASAAAPTFGLVLLARFVAGLPHGAYFGAAGLVAASLMGPGNRARGYAAVLTGLALATVVGVPLITVLGQAAGWQAAYLAIAGVFLVTLVAVVAVVPSVDAPPDGSPRAELQAFRTPQVWMVAVISAIGYAGFFAAYSYVAPVTTHVAHLPESAVPWVLATAGAGMSVGTVLGGRAADHDLRRTLLGGFAGIVVAVAVFGLAARTPAGLFVGTFLVGLSALFLGPALQSRLIEAAPGAQLMGAAANQSATNIANSVGAALGGFVIVRGFGYLAPAAVGVGLGLLGLAATFLTYRPRRPSGARMHASVDASQRS